MIEILCRLLLLVHPPRFRREFGGEIARLVRDRARAARGERWPARARDAITVAGDLAMSAPREWRAAWRERRAAAPQRVTGTKGRGEPVRDLFFDIRYALRVLAERPAFTAAALTTLALGIGANTAIYSLADAVLLHPLPVRDLDSLVEWSWSSSYPDFEAYRGDRRMLAGAAAYSDREAISLSVDGRSELVSGAFVSGDYFGLLGVGASAGRLLGPSDDTPGGPVVAVLSHGFWQRRFGGRGDVLDSTVRVNGQPVTLVGVAARGFRGTSLRSAPDLWVPIQTTGPLQTGFFSSLDVFGTRNVSWLRVIARLRPGVSASQAAAALDGVYRQGHPLEPGQEPGERLALNPLKATAIGLDSAGDLGQFMTILTGIVAFALLIACANVANMLLVRATDRRREVGVRLALGASRGRLVRQLLTESLLLGTAGAALGLAVAAGLLRVLSAFELPGHIPVGDLGLGLDGGALAITLGLAIVTSVAFGLAPAVMASGTGAVQALRSDTRTTGQGRLRGTLVAVQIALCLVLLAGTGLFGRALRHALAIDPGFDVAGVATAVVDPGLERLTVPEVRDAYDRAVARLEAMPGVEAAAWAAVMPLMGGDITSEFSVDGYQPRPGEEMSVHQTYVGEGYFKAMGIPLVRGRAFTAADREGSGWVAVVNEAFVRRYLGGGDGIGRRVRVGLADPQPSPEIVGVATDSLWNDLTTTADPLVYLPFRQYFDVLGTSRAWLIVRAPGRAGPMAGTLRTELVAVDPRLAAYRVSPLSDRLDTVLMPQRMGLVLLAFFGAATLLLAAVGIHGVTAYAVAQRRREIGIRLALGAEPVQVRRLMFRQSFRPIAAGIAAGLGAAALAAPLAASFLYGVSPLDPLTYAGVALVVTALAALAGDLPARRAMRIDPAETLRAE